MYLSIIFSKYSSSFSRIKKKKKIEKKEGKVEKKKKKSLSKNVPPSLPALSVWSVYVVVL